MRKYKFEAGAMTDKGRFRPTNQDRCFLCGSILAEAGTSLSAKTSFAGFGVFDGMGGEHCGAEAAAETAQVFARFCEAGEQAGKTAPPSDEALAAFYTEAHAAVAAIQQEARAMSGTTAATLTIRPDGVWISNIGDSRIFHISRGWIERISEDHTLNEVMIRSGAISREEADKTLGKGRLTRFVGAPADECDTAPHIAGPLKVRAGDVFVLCSDGVTDALSVDAILARAGGKGDCAQLAAALVKEAVDGGSKDNCTAVVVRMD